MKKVLFTSHLANFCKFNKPFMAWFRRQGWEVHYASLDEEEIPDCDKHFKVCFNRSPYSADNLKAYFQLKKIIDAENYNIIHCHTPMGGVVTRFAAMGARKRGSTKVLYTAHGFHFFEGSPFINWLLYYPVEKFLARFTDCLIVMNNEDYRCAVSKKFNAGRIEKIDGVGVDLTRFYPVNSDERLKLRKEYGFGEDDFILLCVAEFTKNKNQSFLINCISDIISNFSSIKLLFAGIGDCMDDCQGLAQELGLNNSVLFLNYRKDIQNLCRISDIMVSASYREGLPVNIIEGMATGLPVVCTKIRGHVDIVNDGKTGILYNVEDTAGFEAAIVELFENSETRKAYGISAVNEVSRFSLEKAVGRMAGIYEEFMI